MSFTECHFGNMIASYVIPAPGWRVEDIIAHSEERYYVSGLLNKFNRIIWWGLIEISVVKLRMCHILDVEPRLVER